MTNTLQSLKRSEEAAQILTNAVLSPTLAPSDRRDLFRKLAVMGGADHLRRTLPHLISELINSSSMSYPDLRLVAVDGMIVISASPEYADFHHDMDRDSATSGPAGWLSALSWIRKGDQPRALATLETLSKLPLTPREKRVINEELARMLPNDPDRAVALYREIIPVAPDPDRLRLTTAQILFRSERHSEAAEILLQVDSKNLGEAQLGVFKNVLLASLAKNYPQTPLIEMFEREAAGLRWERIREIAEAPFVTMSSGVFEDLRKALAKRVVSTTAPAELHVLRLSLANRLDDPDELLSALSDFVTARPDAIDAVQEFADLAAQRAYMLATMDLTTSPPAEQAKQVGDAAATALWKVVAIKPYVPEPYLKLIELYRLYGQPEKAARVPLALADSTTTTAEEIHLAAYVSAQADLVDQAITLYERALAIDPSNTRFRLNYAGALTRAKRSREADAIYRDIIANGVHGRQYHAHEIYANSINTAEMFGYRDDYFAFLRSLINRPEVPQHEFYLLEMGKIMLGLHHTEEAIVYFEALRKQYPNHAFHAMDYLVQAQVELKDFDKAEQLLTAQEAESTDTAGLLLVRSNRAATKAARGDINGAVTEYKNLAQSYPNERQAIRGFITGAQLLIKEGRLRAATELLNSYLALDAGDPDAEASAREVLRQIQTKDLPSDILVKSALEDTLPPQ